MQSHVFTWFSALLCAASLALPTFGQSTPSTLTYQGRLDVNGAPLTGTADFQFRLFNSSGGNIQVGPTIPVSNVNVGNGIFTVPINFGFSPFDGNQRFLEIAVRSPAGSGSFVILNQRQAITPAPYALKALTHGHALSADDGVPFTALYVDSEGEVGIGTSTPEGKLDVRAGGGSYFMIDSANGDIHMNGGTDTVAGIYNDSTGLTARTDFIVNNQAHMSLNGAGHLGVGTTTPLRRFSVVDGNLLTARFENTHPVTSVVEFANTTSGAVWEFGVTGSQPPFGITPGGMYFYRQGDEFGPPMVINPNHWIGMGVTQPGFRLDLPNIGNEDGRGRANAWVTYSSARWKENVQPIEDALDTIMSLRGVSFDWKAEHGGARDIGFVAEEVGAVVPEIVTWEDDGQWAQGLAYDRITALAVQAIKEQQGQIETLKQANDDMRMEIEEMRRLLAETVAAVKAERH